MVPKRVNKEAAGTGICIDFQREFCKYNSTTLFFKISITSLLIMKLIFMRDRELSYGLILILVCVLSSQLNRIHMHRNNQFDVVLVVFDSCFVYQDQSSIYISHHTHKQRFKLFETGCLNF